MVKLIYRIVLIAGLVSFLSANSHAQSNDVPRRPQTLRLANMQAMLFFENTGKFSPDVFTNQVNLWNTTIEGASREGASESMLVVVEIRSEGEGRLPRNRKVQLTARYRIADRSGWKSGVLTRRDDQYLLCGNSSRRLALETGFIRRITARIVVQKAVCEEINSYCGSERGNKR